MSFVCFAGHVFADTTNFNVILGTTSSRLINKRYISPATGLINSYASNEAVKTRPFYGLGLEYNFDNITAQPITLGVGLGLYDIGRSNINGIETPGVNIILPPQDTLSYQIQIKNITLLLEPKLVYTSFHLQPFVLGGFGYARNTLKHFTEATIPGSAALPAISPYSNHTQTKFAYEAGLGLQYVFGEYKQNHNIILHLEYRYLNIGQSRLGRNCIQTTNQHITVEYATNIVDFGITYRI